MSAAIPVHISQYAFTGWPSTSEEMNEHPEKMELINMSWDLCKYPSTAMNMGRQYRLIRINNTAPNVLFKRPELARLSLGWVTLVTRSNRSEFMSLSFWNETA